MCGESLQVEANTEEDMPNCEDGTARHNNDLLLDTAKDSELSSRHPYNGGMSWQVPPSPRPGCRGGYVHILQKDAERTGTDSQSVGQDRTLAATLAPTTLAEAPAVRHWQRH